MSRQSLNDSFEEWLETIPHARMGRPITIFDRLKYVLWFFYTPFHGTVRDFCLALGVVRHDGRQQFLLGKLVPDASLQDLIQFLVEEGYGKHFVAWKDDDEVISLRKAHDFKHQYHLRIFHDGEVRGHFEYTPESKPFKHLKAVAQESKSEEFLALLDEWIVPV